MKKMFLGLLLVATLSGCGDKAMNIQAFGQSPTPILSKVTLVGVVAGVHPKDPRLFALQDLKEGACKSEGCEKFILPVQFDGGAPKPGETVTVVGALDLKKKCFIATKMRKLKLTTSSAPPTSR